MTSLSAQRGHRQARSARGTLAAAQDYASRGWQVFPLRRWSKIPLPGSRGFLDATSDPAKIERWFRFPIANLGIRTGHASNGLVVVDFDFRNGATLDDAWPETLTADTASGGLHKLYRWDGPPVPSSAGRLGKGIDVRAEAGYFVGPPSVTRDSGWTWVDPEVLIAPLPPAVAALASTPVPGRATGSKRSDSYGPGFALREDVGSGERNSYMASLAGALLCRGNDSADVLRMMLDENARVCRPPLDRCEVEAVADSIERRYHS